VEVKIFDVKELIGKIFPTKHLALAVTCARIGARAMYLGGVDANRARSDVTAQRFRVNIAPSVRKRTAF
jgi:hypothetical protein